MKRPTVALAGIGGVYNYGCVAAHTRALGRDRGRARLAVRLQQRAAPIEVQHEEQT